MSDGTITLEQGGYRITFHPAFASKLVISGYDGEVEVYRQNRPYILPAGYTLPPNRHQITLTGGGSDHDLTLEIYDPKHRVARITVELHGEDHILGIGGFDKTLERMVVEGDALTCPPVCDAF